MRIDKFLKVSRIIKRRTVANEVCDADRVSVNGRPVRASYDVKVGDIVEITMGENRHTVQGPCKADVHDYKIIKKRKGEAFCR